jgi:hypothetical protein
MSLVNVGTGAWAALALGSGVDPQAGEKANSTSASRRQSRRGRDACARGAMANKSSLLTVRGQPRVRFWRGAFRSCTLSSLADGMIFDNFVGDRGEVFRSTG